MFALIDAIHDTYFHILLPYHISSQPCVNTGLFPIFGVNWRFIFGDVYINDIEIMGTSSTAATMWCQPKALGEPIKVDSTMDSTGVLRADWQDTA